MKIFTKLYQKMLIWSRHKKASYILFWLSFAESSVFPIPPDIMLAPMVLAKPESAWKNAFLCTMGGVLGAFLGYLIGMFCFFLIKPLLIKFGYFSDYQTILYWFQKYNFWLMFFAGFAFIPYKLFTIAAGVVKLKLVPFFLGSLVGRGGRFFLVAGLVKWGGPKIEQCLENHIEHLAWLSLVLLGLGYCLWHFTRT